MPSPRSSSAIQRQAISPFRTGHYFLNDYAGSFRTTFARRRSRAESRSTLEFESGLQEKDNHFTVGFDPNAAFFVAAPGMNLKGGLMYIGVNGNPDYQGHPIHNQFAPRGGIAWSLTERHVFARLRVLWVPEQFNGVTEAVVAARGYTASTSFLSSNDGGLTPAGTLSNRFRP